MMNIVSRLQKQMKGFTVTTPLKAWNGSSLSCTSSRTARFNVTTPLKAWNVL